MKSLRKLFPGEINKQKRWNKINQKYLQDITEISKIVISNCFIDKCLPQNTPLRNCLLRNLTKIIMEKQTGSILLLVLKEWNEENPMPEYDRTTIIQKIKEKKKKLEKEKKEKEKKEKEKKEKEKKEKQKKKKDAV